MCRRFFGCGPVQEVYVQIPHFLGGQHGIFGDMWEVVAFYICPAYGEMPYRLHAIYILCGCVYTHEQTWCLLMCKALAGGEVKK